MEKKQEIRYINHFYTDGSAAIQPQAVPKKKPVRRPKPKAKKVELIAVDPLGLAGVVVAVVMAVLLVVGWNKLTQAQQYQQLMAEHVQALRQENVELEEDYRQKLDLEKIESQALALGLVPAEQVEQIPIRVQVSERVEEPTFWQRLWEGLTSWLA